MERQSVVCPVGSFLEFGLSRAIYQWSTYVVLEGCCHMLNLISASIVSTADRKFATFVCRYVTSHSFHCVRFRESMKSWSIRSRGCCVRNAMRFAISLIWIDPGTVRLVAQRLNHNVTPGHQAKSTCRLFAASHQQRMTWQLILATRNGVNLNFFFKYWE
jgi:hypothetical protein